MKLTIIDFFLTCVTLSIVIQYIQWKSVSKLLKLESSRCFCLAHSHSDKIKIIEFLNTAEMNAAAQANYALLQSISDRCNFK